MSRLHLLILFSFLSLTMGCASVGTPFMAQAFEDDIQEGRKLIQSGHLKQAVDDLSVFLEMAPKNEEARFLRALAYQGLEQFPAAVKDYELVIKNNPKSVKSHYNLGMILAYKLNEPGHALEHFDEYLSLYNSGDNSGERAYSVAKLMCAIDQSFHGYGGPGVDQNTLPGLLIEAGKISDPSEKRKKLAEIAKDNPSSPVPLYLIGKSYESEGKRDEAIKSYEEALKLHLTCGVCHESLGNLLLQKRRTEEGQSHKKKAQLFMASERDWIPNEELSNNQQGEIK